MNLDDDAGILTAENGRNFIKEVKAMKQDIFPSLDFNCLQRWAMTFAESCFPGSGIHQITLREYNLWNKENPELSKELRLRSKSHPQYLVIIHLSEKYEYHDRRAELIKAVHGPTIWEEQNYLALGIDTAFFDCIKRPPISKICEEMQRFVFWCYGAQQDEYSPETNGHDWPLHADPKGDFWLLYPKASSDLKPQSQFPDRFTPSYSFSGSHTGDGMEFVSEIRDIDDVAFVTFKEMKLKGIDVSKVELMSQNDKISGYRIIFMGVGYETPISAENYDNERPDDLKDVAMCTKIGFLREFKEKLFDTVDLYIDKLEQRTVDSTLGIVEYSRTMTDGVKYIFRKYSLHEYLRRSFLGFDIFAIPTRILDVNAFPDREVYFKRSEVENLLPMPGVTPGQPTDPILEWLDTVPMDEINQIWKAFLKSQNHYIEKQKPQRGKIVRVQIGKAELKIFLKSALAASSLPDYITNGLTLKYTPSREKEGFFCDIVRQMAKKEGKQEIAMLRNEVLYEKIRKSMKAF